MGCDMVVALGRAAVDGQTLFGQNSGRPIGEKQVLCRTSGREFAPGEKIRTQYLEVLQPRKTVAVLATRPDGWWGYCNGVNEHGVVMGCATLQNKISCSEPGLTGGDLVRLALERCHSARHGVDLLGELIERHGQSCQTGSCYPAGGDNGFLVADGAEAFAVETAGHHWVYQEVRAVSNVCLIHQDWDRISPGLASFAIAQGWWPRDGRKLDFAATCSDFAVGQASGLRRWGRSTLLLEQQNGHIDAPFLRRVLSDHYEGTHFEVDPNTPCAGPVPLCQHGNGPRIAWTGFSTVVQIGAKSFRLPIVWYAFGPPCVNVYFPLFLEGELPQHYVLGNILIRMNGLEQKFRNDPERWDSLQDGLGRLQVRFDHEAEEFALEGASLKKQGCNFELQRLAGTFMQHTLEQFELFLEEFDRSSRKPTTEYQEELVSYF